MADRFEDLRALVAVVSAGGFAAGAERLGVAKSAVSRRIRELEDRLGARLFDRTTRRVQLTEAGLKFHDRAVELLAGLEEAEEAASSASGDLKGRIRVTAPVYFTTHCLAPVLGQFLERHPAVTLSIDTDDHMVDLDRKSTRLNSSHANISYAVFCLKKKISCILFQQSFFSYPF